MSFISSGSFAKTVKNAVFSLTISFFPSAIHFGNVSKTEISASENLICVVISSFQSTYTSLAPAKKASFVRSRVNSTLSIGDVINKFCPG